jgi:hypothetical protein
MSAPLVITSGAYVGADIAAELGLLPPSFLPIGNRRLFHFQLTQFAPVSERIVLSLPSDFELDPFDQRLLAEQSVQVVRSDPKLPLGSSVTYALAAAGITEGPVQILHGDTLFFGLDASLPDHVTFAETTEHYRWAQFRLRDGEITWIADDDLSRTGSRQVLTGYFHLADAALMIECMEQAGGFVTGLDAYARRRPLKPLAAEHWLDFGHVNTFCQSRGRISTGREFNALQVSRRTVVKKSAQREKMAAEVAWYRALPPRLKTFAPTLVDADLEADPPGYELEHLYLTPLNDLFVFGRLPRLSWRQIFRACDEFIGLCREHPAPAEEAARAEAIYGEKSLRRLHEFARATGFDPARPLRVNGIKAPPLGDIVRRTIEAVPAPGAELISFLHGDMSFGNLFYDFRAHTIRAVDPRGVDGLGRPSVFGDIRYDIAKLYQCAIGGYDFIMAGYCDLAAHGPYDWDLALPLTPRIASIQEEFEATRFGGLSAEEASAPAISILLFISMLPLHRDDPARQQALLANAVRLYAASEGEDAWRASA